jgi:hypothetical protein
VNTAVPEPVYVACVGDAVRDRYVVLSTWQGALGDETRHHAAKYDWFYLGCPWGTPLLELLNYTPKAACVGTCATGPRRMLWQGREMRAGVLVDMAVTAQHRTLGPALILQAGLMAAAADRFDLLYGFPNPKATAVVRRAGYPVIGELRRFSCVLRHGSYFARLMPKFVAQPMGWLVDRLRDGQRMLRAQRKPRLVATWHDCADPRMDELWLNSEHGSGLIAIRDAAMLRWRFDALPGIRTRYLCLTESGKDSLLAWFACQIDGTTLHVRDFWSCDAAQGMRRSHIDALIRAARRDERYAAVSVEYAAPAAKLSGWLAAGFVAREGQPIVGRWLHENETAGAQEWADFHLTAADEDE